MAKTKYRDINEYISTFPNEVQEVLLQIRETIHQAVPEATETVRYQMPTFQLKGNFIHFAAFKNHIGLYLAPPGIEAFEKELAAYKTGKGSVQFPLDKPIPNQLIAAIVKFRAKENREKNNPTMVNITVDKNCGNAPKIKLLKDFQIALVNGDLGTALNMLSEDVDIDIPGYAKYKGKKEVEVQLQKNLKRSPVTELIIENMLSHGKHCVGNGSLKFVNNDHIAFCCVYTFSSHSKYAKLKKIKLYLKKL